MEKVKADHKTLKRQRETQFFLKTNDNFPQYFWSFRFPLYYIYITMEFEYSKVMYLQHVFKHCNPFAHWPPLGPPPHIRNSDLAHCKQHPHSSYVQMPLSQQCGGGGQEKLGTTWHKHEPRQTSKFIDTKTNKSTAVTNCKPIFSCMGGKMCGQ